MTGLFIPILSFLPWFVSVAANCIHSTSFFPRAEGHVPVSNFGYEGIKGPLNWADLDPANCACRSGTLQSPIVLSGAIPTAISVATLIIPPMAQAQLANLGTTVEVAASGKLNFAGGSYELKQFHLHTPSEHRMNGEHFPLEMHMVHQALNGTLLVVVVLFEFDEKGFTTDLLTAVAQNIAQVAEPGTSTTIGPIDFRYLAAAVTKGPLFQYTGSLTTPPCSQGVTFLVLQSPLPVNVRTYKQLKAVIKFNARYSQNTLGRPNLLGLANALANKQSGRGCATGGTRT
ncbi:carbonate dehydratase [Mycena crocata]|nr:carbonate dehydratase [Mycena crocata]